MPHTNKKAFQASDFEFLCDKLNAGLGGSTSVSSSDPRLLSGDKFLRCVNLRMSPEAVCTPLICPLMLHLTLSLLPQPWCLKVSTDGTYRLLFEQYTLLTLGVNVKKRQEGASYAFRSSFVPLAFCFAHVEDGGAYGPFAQTVMEVAQAIGHPLNASHVLQFHGDLHKGVESRSAVFPHSQRLSDWAHATGATSQGPSGLHGYFHQVFGDSQLTCFLLQWCRISRTMTLLLFHEVWSHIFAMLEELDYAQVARNIQRQYFQCVAGPGDVSLWSAPWRSGPDRIMPGTDAGSAPQESWHGNSLKPAFAVRKYDPFELATHLQATIVDPQLQDLQGRMKDDASFEDWPAVGKYFDQHILHNSCALAKEGRVPPQALLGLNLHQSFQDAAGNTWMLLPKSTLKVDWAKSGRKKAYKHRALDRLPPNAVEKFADMVRATSNLQIKEAWQNLGFYSADGRINWKGAAKMFDDWNVVLSGPLARQFWQLHHILLSRQTFRIATSMPFTSASIAQLLRSGALVSICMHRCSITTSSTSAACHVPRPKVDQPKRLDQLPPQFLPAHSWSRLGAPCFFVSVVLAQIHTANGHFVFRPNSQSRLRALVSCDACPTSNNCSPSHLYYVRFCGDFWVQCRCCPQHHDASGQRRDLRYLHNLACFFFRFFLVASCILFFVRDVKPSFNAHVTCFCKADASASPAAPSSPSAAEA